MTVQEAIDYLSEGYCDVKPTDDEDMIKLKHKHNDAYEIALEALEKQIPKKPFRISDIDSNDNAFVDCPICKAGNETSIKTIKQIYCWRCGQSIKWE